MMHSSSEELHIQHLREVFQRFKTAGLTLRRKKCHIRMSEVPYLGHVFSATGMAPDQDKVLAIREWPVQVMLLKSAAFLDLHRTIDVTSTNFHTLLPHSIT